MKDYFKNVENTIIDYSKKVNNIEQVVEQNDVDAAISTYFCKNERVKI